MKETFKYWYVYIIETESSQLYTGITVDFKKRLEQHTNSRKGAKFFRLSKPRSLVYLNKVNSRSEASKLEAKIKKLKRSEKIDLIASTNNQIIDIN